LPVISKEAACTW